jgi:hypothetical protein
MRVIIVGAGRLGLEMANAKSGSYSSTWTFSIASGP